MAVLYITEFSDLAQTIRGAADFPQEPALAEQTVAIGAGSVQSSAFNAATTYVRIAADAVCSITFGTNPTATATKRRIAANVPGECFGVPVGQSYKVAVITNT
jgi:hypothetical protein